MRRLAAGVLTVLLMGILAWSGLRRPPSESGAESESESKSRPVAGETETKGANPAEDRIRTLLDSAWEGDVTKYLAAFDGPIRQRLEREVDERGRATFAESLRTAARSRKSHAVFAAESEGEDSARVTVETVYTDRNERQTYRVDRRPGGWLVTDVETIRGHQPKAKYGTPANYQEPEAPPVSSGSLTVETGEETTSPNP